MSTTFPDNWYKHSFHAMGSDMAIWLETHDVGTAAVAFSKVERLFEANEQALSRFRPDSELSVLNGHSGQWVRVSRLLWDLMTLALQMAKLTGGYYDPTILNALKRYGYTVSFDQLTQADSSNPAPLMPLPLDTWTAIELNEADQAVLLPAGMSVDLGGIAKGYSAQQAVGILRDIGPCLVDAGGDLAAGPAPRFFPGWPIAVSSPWATETGAPADMFVLWIADETAATSGIDYRNWQHNGRRVHHLIDPATGAPAATDGQTATILADEAVVAEAWATSALVAGSERGMEALLDAGLAGLMVTQSGNVLVTPSMHERLQGQANHQAHASAALAFRHSLRTSALSGTTIRDLT
ncbi:MAG: FAD:protein FMN transferase [Candidatus Promineifilaceae bacterium]